MAKYKIKMFMDYVCEFCYLSYCMLDKLKKEFDIEIDYILFEIHTETPKNGIPMKSHMPQKTRFTNNINKILQDYNKAILDKEIFSNTRNALILGVYLKEIGKIDIYNKYLWKKYMEDGENISSINDLYDISLKLGISPNKLNEILNDPIYLKVLDMNHDGSNLYGIKGVPSFIINDEYIMRGCQSENTWIELFKKIDYDRVNR